MKPKLTETGHHQLSNRLARLKKSERVRTARKFCDFREDVTYTETAREYERIEADI